MKYRAQFEENAALIAAIPNWKDRKAAAERAAFDFEDSNPLFFKPLFMHACRVEYIPKREMQEAKTRFLMVKEEEQGRNWYIVDIEKHIMGNVHFQDMTRKVPRKAVNGYYWNGQPGNNNPIERAQTGLFLDPDELRNERFRGQPVQYLKPCYKNYNPYDEVFEQPDEHNNPSEEIHA